MIIDSITKVRLCALANAEIIWEKVVKIKSNQLCNANFTFEGSNANPFSFQTTEYFLDTWKAGSNFLMGEYSPSRLWKLEDKTLFLIERRTFSGPVWVFEQRSSFNDRRLSDCCQNPMLSFKLEWWRCGTLPSLLIRKTLLQHYTDQTPCNLKTSRLHQHDGISIQRSVESFPWGLVSQPHICKNKQFSLLKI